MKYLMCNLLKMFLFWLKFWETSMVTSQRSCRAVLLYYGHFSISYILVNHIQLKSSVHVHSTYRYIFLILKLQHSLIHILLDVCRWKSEAFGWLWVLQMDRLLQLLILISVRCAVPETYGQLLFYFTRLVKTCVTLLLVLDLRQNLKSDPRLTLMMNIKWVVHIWVWIWTTDTTEFQTDIIELTLNGSEF